MNKNPFKPTFGSIPVAMAGRETIIHDIQEGLDNAPGDPNRASILIGARGTGKTVLLASIAEKAQEQGWISINVTSGPGMLDEIIVQARSKAAHLLSTETKVHLSGIQLGTFGITLERNALQSTWREEMTRIVRELNEQGTGLLITVDEISPQHEQLRLLADVFQHFVRERRDTALLLAGLPGNVSLILRDDTISFLRRAFQHQLGAIDINDVSYAIQLTVEAGGRKIAGDALDIAAESTGGFAFMIQLVGYHMWRQHPDLMQITKEDAQAGVRYASRDLDKMIFDTVVRELTTREEEFLLAMAKNKGVSSVRELAGQLGIEPNNASQIRRRLIARGLIADHGRGKVVFDMPLLREYLLREVD